MATKVENIETLSKNGVDSKNNLKKLSAEELEEMVSKLDVKDVQEPVKKESKSDSNGEVVNEFTLQLGVFDEYTYVPNGKSTVIVENLGNGDVYASDLGAVVGEKSQLIVKGTSKVFKDVAFVSVMAASMPEIKITEKK